MVKLARGTKNSAKRSTFGEQIRVEARRQTRSVTTTFTMKKLTRSLLSLSIAAALSIAGPAMLAEDEAKDAGAYRTDENKDTALPWFQPVKGQFPPEDAAHYVTGELIGVDHLERTIVLRVDRNDSQERAYWDLPMTAAMLPYGTVYYNNQPAALQDIPMGTHLHGWFFDRPEGEEHLWGIKNGKASSLTNERHTPEVDFTRCLRLEDDFTYHARRNEAWKIDEVDLAEKKLTATLQRDGKPSGEPKSFDLTSSTVVFLGDRLGTLESIEPGQLTQMNLTWATLYGPGRVFQIWLDEPSRELAAARQLERHRNHVRERGAPGWVDAVDDETQIITITFFDGIDPTLFEDFKIIVPEPLGWPTSGGAKDDLAPKGTIAVARESLMTYDPVNDRKGGNILKTSKVPIRPGCGGVQIQVECDMLLEGYRPGEVVRFYPASWPVVSLPKEERFEGRE